MGLGLINTLLTKWAFKFLLLKNAYTKADVERFVSQTAFARHEVREDGVGMELWMYK
jgi:hypothetical protein